MKDYSTDDPTFSETVKITEITDLAHADNINYAPKQIFENTLVNRKDIEDILTELGVPDGYDSSVQYEEGDLCVHDGKMYVATEATTGTWDESCWREVTLASLTEGSLDIQYDGESNTLSFTSAV